MTRDDDYLLPCIIPIQPSMFLLCIHIIVTKGFPFSACLLCISKTLYRLFVFPLRHLFLIIDYTIDCVYPDYASFLVIMHHFAALALMDYGLR